MQSKRCVACGQAFHPRAQSPGQCYCSSSGCQRERRRRWQKTRRHEDPAYQENQAQAQRARAGRHPDYWREYRRTHPEYRERNRAQQPQRDARRRRERVLAKMNVSTRDLPVPSGTYRLSPVAAEGLAKMDAWTVEIAVLSTASGDFFALHADGEDDA